MFVSLLMQCIFYIIIEYHVKLSCSAVILEKIVQFQNQKSWKMNLLGLQMKHVILK